MMASCVTLGTYSMPKDETAVLPETSAPKRYKAEVPISEKCLLTLEEAAAYTGIGICKLREMSNDERCGFVLWNGTKRMLKRDKLKAYLETAYSI